MPKQSHTFVFCHCEPVTDVTGVAIRNIPYPTPPVSRPPGRVLYSTARVSGKRKERQIAQKFFWKAGRERSAVLPRPGGLKWCLAAKNHPAAKKQPGEAIFATALAPVLAVAQEQRIAYLT